MINFPISFFLAIKARKTSFTIFYRQKTPFQAIKTRSSKSQKIDIFCKVLVQKWSIFLLFFQAIQARKLSFTIFQHDKTPSQDTKTRSSNSQKSEIFPKEKLTHGFGPEMAIFATFFFLRLYSPGKYLLRYFSTKKKPFYAIKTTSSKIRNFDIFPKGLNHGFGPKMVNFPTFFLAIQARIISFTIFQHEKSPFQAVQTTSLKRREIDIFLKKKLTHGFGPKIGDFFNFFFRQYRPEKYPLGYFSRKNRLSRL